MADSMTPKTFVCAKCEKNFSRLEHLQRHQRTHTKERPFTCFCGRAFARKDMLRRHQGKVHQGEVQRVSLRANPPGQKVHAPTPQVNPPLQDLQAFPNDTLPIPTSGVNHGLETPAHTPAMEVDHWQDFITFMENIGLATDWEEPDWLSMPPESTFITEPRLTADKGPPEHKFQKQVVAASQNRPPHVPMPSPLATQWTVSASCRDRLVQELNRYHHVIPHSFVLPSRIALSRYIQSYFEQFHRHFPMIHAATWSPDRSTLSLILVITALGSTYRFEGSRSVPLYRAARAIALEDVRRRKTPITESMYKERTAILQTLTLLMGFAAWDWSKELLEEALEMQSLCADYVRKQARENFDTSKVGDDPGGSMWKTWIIQEEHRRTLLTTYAYLAVQSTTYGLPAVLLAGEVHNLPLPCSSDLWDATSYQYWESGRRRGSPLAGPDLQTAMRFVLDSDSTHQIQTSPYGSFIVLQAIIQRIALLRQLQLSTASDLGAEETRNMESALGRWQILWSENTSSALDPTSPDGPLPFNSAAFLALAYARLHLDIGSHRGLQTRDPQTIATKLLQSPLPTRGPHLTTALLHAAKAICLPVELGLEYVARSQMLFWSCQHSICAFEAAIFLWRWLQVIQPHQNKLSNDEARVIVWIRSSVGEALQTVEPAAIGLDKNVDIATLGLSELGVAVLEIWARTFSGDSMWPIISLVARSLKALATLAR